MAISDKILYLNDTKKLLKQEINKSTEITDEDTFRSYAPKIYDGYLDILNNGTDTLWNNLEKVSASGEEATLENVETAPIKMVLNGNTSQDTTSGKNLIKIVGLSSEEEKTKTVNDVTFTVNDDGTVKVEGTNSGSSRILQAVTYESAVTGEAGTYYYFANSPSQSKRLEMACFVDEKYEYPNSYGTTPWSKTATTNFTIRNIYFVINAGETVNNVYYVILTKNVDPQPYEPYTGGQPSPSPDYPQEVKVVKGENVVSVQGKNLVDIEGIELNPINIQNYEQGNNYIKVTTKATAWANITFRIFLEAGTYYYKHYAFLDSEKIDTSGIGSLRISPSGGGTAIVNQPVAGEYLDKINDITFTIEESGIYIFIYRCANSRKNVRILNINDIILSKTSTDYVPYSKANYPINLGDIELCKINTYKDYFHKDSGKWYVHKSIGKKVVTSSEILAQTDSYSNVIYYKFNKNTDSINYNNYNSMVAFYTHAKISNSFNFDSLSQVSTINSLAENTRYWVGFPKGTTLARAKEKMVGSILYYILATSIEVEITNTTLIEQLEAIYKAKSVKDKTYITQTNEEMAFTLEVEAIKEYTEEQ